MSHLTPDKRRVRFSAGDWSYVALDNGTRKLSRVDTYPASLFERLIRWIQGDVKPPTIRSEFTVIYDTVVGASERPDGATQYRFTFYRNGVKVGSVFDKQLPDPVLNYLQKEAIPQEEFR